MSATSIEEEIDISELLTDTKKLVIYNDDVNTFDYVIDSLVNVCEHTLEQAEQCTYLVHYKGKCTVKTGELKDLKTRCSKLLELGLSAELI